MNDTKRHYVGTAGRKWKRMLSQAIVDSLPKTITEPITNSWDSYKRENGFPANSGIVENLLNLKKGKRIEHNEVLKGIKKVIPTRNIVVRAPSGKGKGDRKTQVIDQAQGMSAQELINIFKEYGGEKGGQPKGKKVRGLFGQGLTDIMFGHKQGEVVSLKDGMISKCTAHYDDKGQPYIKPEGSGIPTKHQRKKYQIEKNGTSVEFTLSDKCHVPLSLYERLSDFYMLRLINADPTFRVLLEQTIKGNTNRVELTYNFPSGEVLLNFNASLKYLEYPNVKIEGIIARANEILDVGATGDDRQSGLLVVDEADTVYDLTLFGFDKVPGLERLYGVVKLTGFREIAQDRLDNHGEAIISDSRDGFSPKHLFTKELWKILTHILEPIIEEEKKRGKGEGKLCEESKKKVDNALKELNRLYSLETDDKSGSGDDGKSQRWPEKVDKAVFLPKETTLIVDRPTQVHLIVDKNDIDSASGFIVASDNPNINISPEQGSLKAFKEVKPGILAHKFTVQSSALGSKGTIEALIEVKSKTDIQTYLLVKDVIAPEQIQPPEDGMEFRPFRVSAPPHGTGSASLYINLEMIELGSEIFLKLESATGDISMVAPNGNGTQAMSIYVGKKHKISHPKIAVLPIPYKGHGSGQKAKLLAKCKIKGGGKYQDTLKIHIKNMDHSNTGIFKQIIYDSSSRKGAAEFDDYNKTIYINSSNQTNRAILGRTQEEFDENIRISETAQIHLAEILLTEVGYWTLAKKSLLTGNNGFSINEYAPIGSVRQKMEEWKHDIGASVYRALVSNFSIPR